jgi:1,4-alpha-glucan branching enzyme
MTESQKGGKKRVKFSVKAEPGSEVYVAGTFNNWDPKKHKLTCADGVYSATISVPPGRHEYKFVITDVWCIDPECPEWAPNGIGSLNSVIVVG